MDPHLMVSCLKLHTFIRPHPHKHTHTDESFAVTHDTEGILGMANHGPNTNNSQFYITLKPAIWMDRTYVAFG